jgi:hypothetical protein
MLSLPLQLPREASTSGVNLAKASCCFACIIANSSELKFYLQYGLRIRPGSLAIGAARHEKITVDEDAYDDALRKDSRCC